MTGFLIRPLRDGREKFDYLPVADPGQQAWVSAAFSFQGLKALGVPQDSLDSFPMAFQQGMAARATHLGDTGENAPENWEQPFGGPMSILRSPGCRPTQHSSRR